PHKLSRPSIAPTSAASHTEPSADSPSPSSTYVRYSDLMRRALSAHPTPAQIPWPSEPVATSTNGSRGVGWPSRSDPIVRSFRSSPRSNAPASAHAAYNTGAACPFDRMNRSLSGWRGSLGSNRISAKKSAATRSAAEQQLVGWPLPASDVDLRESIRSRVATFFNAGINEERSRAIGDP